LLVGKAREPNRKSHRTSGKISAHESGKREHLWGAAEVRATQGDVVGRERGRGEEVRGGGDDWIVRDGDNLPLASLGPQQARHCNGRVPADVGVDLVVYLGFYYIQNLNKVIDYGTALLSRMCATSDTPCVFCDPRNLTIPIGWDGLHPTREGFLMIGELISNALTQE
jgi:hypothetical protein